MRILSWYSGGKNWHYFEPSGFSTFHTEQKAVLSQNGINWIIHNIACELFPKGSVANDAVATRWWGISDTQLLRIPLCLQRSLAVRMHALLGYVRRKEKSAITELSLKNHLNAVSAWKLLSEAVHLLWAVRNEDAIMERGYWSSSSLLCWGLYVVVAAVHDAARDTVSPHRLVFLWCWFLLYFAQIWQMQC